MTHLFLDLDGVMADFDADFEARTGLSPAAYCELHGDFGMWERINSFDRFFANLPPCPGALTFFDWLRHYHEPMILTACPKSDYKGVADQKRAWVRKHLGDDVIVLPTLGATSKPRFMQKRGDILVDDFKSNTDAWIKEGGVGILHRNFNDTMRAVLEHSYP